MMGHRNPTLSSSPGLRPSSLRRAHRRQPPRRNRQINKTDPNDARSVAVAALRAQDLPQLTAEDHTIVLRVWSPRYRDLGRLRTQLLCRLHSVLCELVPDGFPQRTLRGPGDRGPRPHRGRFPHSAGETRARPRPGRRPTALDTQRREAKRRTAQAVAAAHTTITEIDGVGPIVASTVLGYVRNIRRFRTRDHF